MSIKDNHYYKYIINKYLASKGNYNTIFQKNDNPYDFLLFYENMNVYPTFPQPIVLTVKHPGETFEHTIKMDMKKINKYKKMVDNKITEYMSYINKISSYKNKQKIRRYFDYEIRDTLKKLLGKDITNAWVKMYELLVTYQVEFNESNVNTFHICEHPGKFIFAIKDYINKVDKPLEHHFVFQSLNPRFNTEGFRVDKHLLHDKSGILDYGITNTGDITDINNIMHYIKKYQHQKFKLITSDCGLDFGDDFTKQETGLYKIFLSALIVAIGLSSNDSMYVFKFFSLFEEQTIQMIYIASQIFEKVDIVRVMTTKGPSGENYCVCSHLNPNINKEVYINQLLEYMKNTDAILFDQYDSRFIERINDINKVLAIRRITAINQMIFRLLNFTYVTEHPETIDMVQKYVDYYTNYFINYIIKNKKENSFF